jgi:hypothetical protein
MLVIEYVTCKFYLLSNTAWMLYDIFSYKKTSLIYSFFVSFQYEWMALDGNKKIFDTKG